MDDRDEPQHKYYAKPRYPRYAVYWDDPDDDSLGVVFFVTLEEAKVKAGELIRECERASVNHERALDWDITILEIVAEVHDSPDGYALYPAQWIERQRKAQ
jgi:hypothetical protein